MTGTRLSPDFFLITFHNRRTLRPAADKTSYLIRDAPEDTTGDYGTPPCLQAGGGLCTLQNAVPSSMALAERTTKASMRDDVPKARHWKGKKERYTQWPGIGKDRTRTTTWTCPFRSSWHLLDSFKLHRFPIILQLPLPQGSEHTTSTSAMCTVTLADQFGRIRECTAGLVFFAERTSDRRRLTPSAKLGACVVKSHRRILLDVSCSLQPMLRLFRKKGRRADKVLETSPDPNVQPSEEQEHHLDSAHNPLLDASIPPPEDGVGLYLAGSPIPQEGLKGNQNIEFDEPALSSLQKVPRDIWHIIFQYDVLGIEPKTSHFFRVETLRLVSKAWNATAVTCPELWCNLPILDITTLPTLPVALYRLDERNPPSPTVWSLDNLLDRSQTLPISFTFRYWYDEVPNAVHNTLFRIHQKDVLHWIRRLVEQSHRWQEVEFQVSTTLSTSWSGSLRGVNMMDAGANLDFSGATQLRHFKYDALGSSQELWYPSAEWGATNFRLPWSQLETFECAVKKCAMYPTALELGTNLKVLKYTSYNTESLPSSATLLPHLSKLSLCFVETLQEKDLIEHLECFTLPSLKELEGAPLNAWGIEHNNLDYDLQLGPFLGVLRRCPSLTHLDIAYLDAEHLDSTLLPHLKHSKRPPLPNLRVLTLRHPRGSGSIPPGPLMNVIFGRTDPARKPPNSHLEDVYVTHDDPDLWREEVVELEHITKAPPLQTPFDPGFYSIGLAWTAALRDGFSTNDDASRLRLVLQEMKSFDFNDRDTRVLVPILLGDFRSSAYRYCYADENNFRLILSRTSNAIDMLSSEPGPQMKGPWWDAEYRRRGLEEDPGESFSDMKAASHTYSSTLTILHRPPCEDLNLSRILLQCLEANIQRSWMLGRLLGFRRKESTRRRAATWGSLLNSNEPPSVEQRQELEAHLVFLESEYQKACGRENTPCKRVPATNLKESLKYHKSIERFHRALSCVRTVPVEVWHVIFMWSVLSIEPRSSRCSMVGIVRLVSRGWNAAACSCPELWSDLPIISSDPRPQLAPSTSSVSKPFDIATGPWILEQYLGRSGCQPISFTFSMRLDTDDPPRPHMILAKAYLQILLEASFRWKVVKFKASKAILDALLDRSRLCQLPLPRLSEFAFQLLIVTVVPNGSKFTVDLFGDVPALKHITFTLQDTWGLLDRRRINEVVDLRLPWRQLESFEGNLAYTKLGSEGTNLRRVRYSSKSSDDLPSTPTSYPRLTELDLYLADGLQGEHLLRHLGCLTLPMLKQLELYWQGNSEADLYGTILALVQRSKCSLERLATGPNLNYNRNDQLGRFRDVLYHCSTITHLDISYLEGSDLDILIPDHEHFTTPPLANLRVLTLRFSRLVESSVDPTSLLRVIHSRAEGAKGLENRLQDVYIKHCSNDYWRAAVAKLGNQAGSMRSRDLPTDSGSPFIARRWKQEIMTSFPRSKTGRRLDKADYMERQETRRVFLGKLESLDIRLWGRDNRILSWLGIPALLNSIGLDKEGKPDKWKTFSAERQRAQELLKKWKPHLLTDFRSSPYRWCYVDESTSRIRYVRDTAPFEAEVDYPESESRSEEEKDWERILGKGDIDHWAAGSKGFA
ncbi:hypothetical protein NMY22_g5232 [Coprinellus aureogranulatus]|nr:hypothetical protein NMY22_g5232 [Coprinellus aureogranulatus]